MKINNGFTLIETIIAIFILTAGILGSYLVFYNIYNQSGGLSYKLTAAYLAQEGIEIIRNMRDNNWIKNSNENWIDGIITSNNCANGCDFEADYRTGTGAVGDIGLTPYAEKPLNIDGDGLYLYDVNYSTTIFKRKITITGGSNDFFGSSDIFEVDSTVMWQYKGKDFLIKITDFLYNWY